MGVVSRRWMWVESMGVVVRRYIDFLMLLSLLLLYLFFFAAASYFLFIFKLFSFFIKEGSSAHTKIF